MSGLRIAGVLALLIGAAMPAIAQQQVVKNGSMLKATDGSDLQAHGAGVIKVGSYYYIMGENRKDDGHFNAVSMYRSTDLATWEYRNDILKSTSATELNVSNIERPKVIYNAATGKYVLWAHYENGQDYSQARVIVATSDTVDGNYTYLGSFRPLDYSSRDMTLYKDDDGTGYLISSTNNNYDLNVYQLSADYTRIDKLVYVHDGFHREAPAVFKRGSTYFMVTSGATGWTPNQAAYQTASSMAGPWTNPTSFGNGTTYSSQSTYVLPVQGTSGTSYLYMGDRWGPAQNQRVNQSQYVWLPLSFPSATTLAMEGRSQIAVDAAAGTVTLVSANSNFRKIRSATSGLCANVTSNLLAYNRSVQQYGCDNWLNEQVEQRASGNDIQFVFQHSGLCLAQTDESTTGGAVVQHGCTQAKAQWYMSGQRIVNRKTGLCLEVPDDSRDAKTLLRTAPCNGAAYQNWSLIS